MQERQPVEETHAISNQEQLELLEEHTNWITNIVDEVTTTMSKLWMAMHSSTQNEFKINNLRMVKYFLEIEVASSWKGIFLSQ